MPRQQPDLFDSDEQPELFHDEYEPKVYRPDPEAVRAQLRNILAEVQGARTLPWSDSDLRYYRTAFPQMANWLPPEEGEQLCFAFETELVRLKAA